MNADDFALGVLWYVVFLLSTTCHEAAHALVSLRGGDPTAAHGGQVSLNPLPHIRRELFGMVIFPWLSFFAGGWMMGWASAPYNPRWAWEHPRRSGAMALAGPCANFALALLAGILIRIGMAAGVFRFPESIRFSHIVQPVSEGFPEAAATILSIMFSLNVLLGAFNLLPLPPLDGWSVLGLILPEPASRKLIELSARFGMMAMLGLLVAWQFFGSLYVPILRFSLGALYGGL